MNCDDLLRIHDELCGGARSIISAKNADYTAGNTDALSNFKASQIIGVEPELGLMVRWLDKVKRIESFIRRGVLEVSDESIEDTLRDAINYPVLLAALIAERRQTGDKAKAKGTW